MRAISISPNGRTMRSNASIFSHVPVTSMITERRVTSMILPRKISTICMTSPRAPPSAETVARELALFKVSADGASRAEVMQMVEIFRVKIIDVSKRSVIVEVTGSWDKIEAFERMVRPFGLIEMARTGEIAISRGRGET